jgi:hypothetical protein
LRFVGDAEQMQDRVRRAAHRDVQGHRVLEGFEGRDAAWQDAVVSIDVVSTRHLDDALPRALEEFPALSVRRDDGPVTRKREPERFVETIHAIRGEHARARATGRARRALHFEQFGIADLFVACCDHRVDQVELSTGAVMGACALSGFHGSTGYEDRRDIQAHRRQQHPRRDLVAIRDTDQRVGHMGLDHVLDTVCDQISRWERIEHAVVAHRDAVVDGDRVELDAPAPRVVHDFLDTLADIVEMDVARNELGETVGDCDDRLREIGVGHAGRAPESAGARHVAAKGRRAASISLHGCEDRREAANAHEPSSRGRWGRRRRSDASLPGFEPGVEAAPPVESLEVRAIQQLQWKGRKARWISVR